MAGLLETPLQKDDPLARLQVYRNSVFSFSQFHSDFCLSAYNLLEAATLSVCATSTENTSNSI